MSLDNPIVTEQEIEHSTEESQIPRIENKFSLPYNQSLLSSTQDSLKALLCLKKETWTTNKFVLCWLHHSKCWSEKQVRNDHKIYLSERKGLLSSSSQSLKFIGMGKPVPWLSHQKRLGQVEFSERGQPADVSMGNESVFRDANPANVAKSLLERNRDHLLTQARAGLMKQEHKVKSVNNCLNELQQQAYAQRLDLENTHHGYVESRREQVRSQEELVMKEGALRETQNSKNARDGRNEESSGSTN